jgi:hypothetical protein
MRDSNSGSLILIACLRRYNQRDSDHNLIAVEFRIKVTVAVFAYPALFQNLIASVVAIVKARECICYNVPHIRPSHWSDGQVKGFKHAAFYAWRLECAVTGGLWQIGGAAINA